MTIHRAGELTHLIDVYAARLTESADGPEKSWRYERLKTIHAKIVPVRGFVETLGDMTRMDITHRVFIRAAALPEIRQDMYFMYRGQRYDILTYMPVYNQRGWMEIDCAMIVEGTATGSLPDRENTEQGGQEGEWSYYV